MVVLGNGNGNKVLWWEWVGMGIGMTSWEWERMGTVKVIPAHLYWPPRYHWYCHLQQSPTVSNVLNVSLHNMIKNYTRQNWSCAWFGIWVWHRWSLQRFWFTGLCCWHCCCWRNGCGSGRSFKHLSCSCSCSRSCSCGLLSCCCKHMNSH